MRFRAILPAFVLLVVALTVPAPTARADEGMWLFNFPPTTLLKERHDFTPTAEWLTHLQRSAVRFNNGGSGSFVSADGLVMTNHHVGADALQKLSTSQRDLMRSSFYARTPAEELKCPDSELNVLIDIEDVTQRVNAAVTAATGSPEAEKQRRAVMNTIEEESFDQTGLRSDVVTLYQGGLYQLYRYKKYTDVRLVFAPEEKIAFFGGDPDNFEYPRYDLDICFFRVYENGKPVRPPYHLKWNPAGLKVDDLVFVAGNPGKTDRMNTVRHLEFIRDRVLPDALDLLRRREVLLESFSERSAENARRARDLLLAYQNSRKARLGGLAGLQDPAVMDRKRAEQKAFLAAAAQAPCAGRRLRLRHENHRQVAGRLGDDSRRLRSVGTRPGFLQRVVHDRPRRWSGWRKRPPSPTPIGSREYRESNLDSLKQELFSTAPIYDDLQTALLADSLSMYLERKGYSDPLAERVMAGKSPQTRAAELVGGTRLADVAVRRQLANGGMKAIEASDDPMIRLALLVDRPARAVRTRFEQQVEEPQRWAYGKLANARFALFGTETYPDATFTLRLAFGLVQGLPRGWPTRARLDDDGRGVSPRRRARRQGAVRPAAKLVGSQGPSKSGHADELRPHRRHHRRQLGQPGRQPQRRVGRHHFRRQSALAGLGLRIYRRRRTSDRRPRQRHSRSVAEGL